jgi:hypothetical protein
MVNDMKHIIDLLGEGYNIQFFPGDRDLIRVQISDMKSQFRPMASRYVSKHILDRDQNLEDLLIALKQEIKEGLENLKGSIKS